MHPVDLVAGTTEGVVLDAPPREYTRHEFLTTVWKTGNFLRSLGVHEERLVAITADPSPESLLAFFGASLLDARVRFGPPASVDARVVVGPTEKLGQFELPPGGQYVGYGGAPDDPSWSYFERDVWSENPAFPDVEHDLGAALIETGRERYDTGSVIDAAYDVADAFNADDVVAVRAPLPKPGTIVAGVLAPLVADATILLPDDDTTGTVAVASGDSPVVPEGRRVDPESVELVGHPV